MRPAPRPYYDLWVAPLRRCNTAENDLDAPKLRQRNDVAIKLHIR